MRVLLFTIILLLSHTAVQAQGIEFFHGTWEEALAEAKKSQKVIFVDAFATWCGPCKRMARDVFPNEEVGNFYNRYFINMKLDMEKGQGLDFRKEYPVSAFPTLFYINGDGEVVHKVKGAQGVGSFIDLGKKVLSLADNSEDYAKRYEEGERDPEFLLEYVKALNNAGKSSLRVANHYLNDQKDLNTPFNLRFIFESVSEADSRIFAMFIERKEAIASIMGEPAVKDRIEQACQATAQKANEYNSTDLLETAQDKMKSHLPEKAEAFEYHSTIAFHVEQRNPEQYAKACKKYAKKMLKEQPEELNELANTMYSNFGEHTGVLDQAVDIAEMAIDKASHYGYYVTYARILKDLGENQKAIDAAEKALELSRTEGPRTVSMMESFLQQMRS
jgi:thiol-disulfide isomerase/thioredoxin